MTVSVTVKDKPSIIVGSCHSYVAIPWYLLLSSVRQWSATSMEIIGFTVWWVGPVMLVWDRKISFC